MIKFTLINRPDSTTPNMMYVIDHLNNGATLEEVADLIRATLIYQETEDLYVFDLQTKAA